MRDHNASRLLLGRLKTAGTISARQDSVRSFLLCLARAYVITFRHEAYNDFISFMYPAYEHGLTWRSLNPKQLLEFGEDNREDAVPLMFSQFERVLVFECTNS